MVPVVSQNQKLAPCTWGDRSSSPVRSRISDGAVEGSGGSNGGCWREMAGSCWNTRVTFHLLSVARFSTPILLFSGNLLSYFYESVTRYRNSLKKSAYCFFKSTAVKKHPTRLSTHCFFKLSFLFVLSFILFSFDTCLYCMLVGGRLWRC